MKPDTIIFETRPAREKKETEILHLYEPKTTVIRLQPGRTDGDSSIIKQGNRDTTIIIKKGRNTSIAAKKKGNAVLASDICSCVDMHLAIHDTLRYGEYMNYNIMFRNRCTENIVVYSAGFRVTPYNFFGQKVKVLNQLSFVKRYDIPEYVNIPPKDSFEYRFADDLFFEFDLRKSELYKFIFTYSNTKNLSKTTPKRTYLCTENAEKMIFVR